MKHKQYTEDLLKSKVEQLKKMHEIIDKALLLSVTDQYMHQCDIQQKQLELVEEELNEKLKLRSKP